MVHHHAENNSRCNIVRKATIFFPTYLPHHEQHASFFKAQTDTHQHTHPTISKVLPTASGFLIAWITPSATSPTYNLRKDGTALSTETNCALRSAFMHSIIYLHCNFSQYVLKFTIIYLLSMHVLILNSDSSSCFCWMISSNCTIFI